MHQCPSQCQAPGRDPCGGRVGHTQAHAALEAGGKWDWLPHPCAPCPLHHDNQVAMDCCGLLDPGDTVGISWAPRRPPAPPPATAAAPGAGGCKRHVGHAGEYLSDVALDVFRVPLAALVEANRGVLADLSAPVEGVVLVLCPAGGGGGGGSGSRGGGGGGGGLEPRPLSLRPQEQRPAALTGGGGGGGPSSGPGGGNGNASGGGGGNASGGGGGGGGGGSGVGGAQVGPHFAGPRVGGLPLDYCRVWATGCGQEAGARACVVGVRCAAGKQAPASETA